MNTTKKLEKKHIVSLEETKKLAVKISKQICSGDVISLRGSLGTGKTTFARYLIQSILGPDINVTSPTFCLLNIYHKQSIKIYHYDLYRIKQSKELDELGLFDAMNNYLTIIEWPEIALQHIEHTKGFDISFFFENELRYVDIIHNH